MGFESGQPAGGDNKIGLLCASLQMCGQTDSCPISHVVLCVTSLAKSFDWWSFSKEFPCHICMTHQSHRNTPYYLYDKQHMILITAK